MVAKWREKGEERKRGRRGREREGGREREREGERRRESIRCRVCKQKLTRVSDFFFPALGDRRAATYFFPKQARTRELKNAVDK